jgi:hypothetical protein
MVGNPNALTWLLRRPPLVLDGYLRSTLRWPVEA